MLDAHTELREVHPQGGLNHTPLSENLVQLGAGYFTERVQHGEQADIAKQRSQARAYLESHGFIQGYTPDGAAICSVSKLKEELMLKHNSVRDQIGPISREIHEGKKVRRLKADILVDIFDGLQVVDTDVSENGDDSEPQPKQLFYIPDSTEAALDVEAIKRADFHMGVWEIQTNYFPLTYPTNTEGFASHANFMDTTTACLIFHPKYGNGERDASGRLIVTYPDGRRRPISGEFFREHSFRGRGGQKGKASLYSDPARFFLTEAPGLVQAGLIDPNSDFRIVSGSRTENRLGAGMRMPTEKGLVSLNNKVRYNLGTEYAGSTGARVLKLNGDLGAILKPDAAGHMKIVKLIQLVPFGDSQGRLVKTNSGGYIEIRQKEVVFIEPEVYSAEHPHIHALIANMEQFLAFSQRVYQEAGFSLAQLNMKEQSRATGISLQFQENPDFWTFLRTYKVNGLRTLMLCGENSEIPVKLFSGQLDSQSMKAIVNSAAEIASSVTLYEEHVKARISPDFQIHIDQTTAVILEHTAQLIAGSIKVAEGDVHGLDQYDAIFILKQFQKTVERAFRAKGMVPEHDVYQQVLDIFASHPDEDVRALALAHVQTQWHTEVVQESRQQPELRTKAQAALDAFYNGNEELFATASETTGDTNQELEQFEDYKLRESLMGVGIDLGCGATGRLVIPKAASLEGQAEILGIDLFPPTESPLPNLHFAQGDITHIPLDPHSVDFAEANWSVFNDVLMRGEQLKLFSELGRVLKIGGKLRFDVPYLEGGEGSWLETAHEYRQKFPAEKYGTIVGEFPTGAKEFYIYPEAEILALLESHGFEITKRIEWRTGSGKPRLTFEANLARKVTPFLIDQTQA